MGKQRKAKGEAAGAAAGAAESTPGQHRGLVSCEVEQQSRRGSLRASKRRQCARITVRAVVNDGGQANEARSHLSKARESGRIRGISQLRHRCHVYSDLSAGSH